MEREVYREGEWRERDIERGNGERDRNRGKERENYQGF